MTQESKKRIINNFAAGDWSQKVQKHFGQWLLAPKRSGQTEQSEQTEQALIQLWESEHGVTDQQILDELHELHQKMELPVLERRRRWHSVLKIAAVVAITLSCTCVTLFLTRDHWQSDVVMAECYVDNGQKRQIVLPDGTDVWINSGSLLVYPTKFGGDTRTVYLSGEANFKVQKDPDKPFIVNTNHLTIEALGTIFNVCSHMDLDNTTTTLQQGSIKICSKQANPVSIIVFPNEQIVYNNKTGAVTKKIVEAERVSQWVDGYLIFQGASLQEIFHSLEKRYDIVVHYNASKYDGRTFTVRFTPDETLDQTLRLLSEIVTDFKYKVRDKAIYIY